MEESDRTRTVKCPNCGTPRTVNLEWQIVEECPYCYDDEIEYNSGMEDEE